MRRDDGRQCGRSDRGVVDPICAAEDFALVQNSWLLLLEHHGDALTCEEGNPWPAPEQNVAGAGGADALDRLGGKDLDGGEQVVVGCGVDVEVSVLAAEEVEGAGVGVGGCGGVEGQGSDGAVDVGALEGGGRGMIGGHICLPAWLKM